MIAVRWTEIDRPESACRQLWPAVAGPPKNPQLRQRSVRQTFAWTTRLNMSSPHVRGSVLRQMICARPMDFEPVVRSFGLFESAEIERRLAFGVSEDQEMQVAVMRSISDPDQSSGSKTLDQSNKLWGQGRRSLGLHEFECVGRFQPLGLLQVGQLGLLSAEKSLDRNENQRVIRVLAPKSQPRSLPTPWQTRLFLNQQLRSRGLPLHSKPSS